MGAFAGAITGSDTLHVFHVCTTSGTFIPYFSGNIEVLVVAGGGGGGMDMGGGGGGGGVVYHGSYAVTSGTSYTVTVGAGGVGAPEGNFAGNAAAHQFTISATQGGNSVFGAITAVGGGFGGSSYVAYTPNYGLGGAGGCGGGASGYGTSGGGGGVTANTTSGGTGYGNVGAGGNGSYYAGGGGGAGAAGTSATSAPLGANGGNGIQNNILGYPLYWAGGGGGASYSISIGGTGGLGGGGSGALGYAAPGGRALNSGEPGGPGYGGQWGNSPGGAGGANTGGGGGGGSHYMKGNRGGNGGSGIVIIKHLDSAGTSIFNNRRASRLSSLVLALDAAERSCIELAVVAGGGGSGMDMGGGGGGGGVIYDKAYPVSLNTAYPVVIGAGGAGSPGTYGNNPAPGSNGNDSSFGGLTAIGGGGGGSGHWREGAYTGTRQGQPGGSGGGDSPSYGRNRLVGGGGGTKGQGYGGGGGPWFDQYNAGGGGGADQPGSSGSDVRGGSGGRGRLVPITGFYYGGGGGGNGHNHQGGDGGLGGGGGGASYSSASGIAGGSSTNSGGAGGTGANSTGGAGGANSGGGGGGSAHSSSVGASGGSGIVLVRYTGSSKATGGNINTSGGYTIHTFTSSGTFTPTSYLEVTDYSQLKLRTELLNGAAYVANTAGRNSYIEFSNDYDAILNIPDENFAWLNDLSMECVFQVSGTHTNYHGALISSGDWNVNHWAFTINQDNQSIQLRRPYLGYSYSFSTNTWYHVVWTRSGTSNTVYVNGSSIGTQTSSDGIPLVSNATNTGVGRETYAGGFFNLNGRIAIAKIYNRALTSDEVRENFYAIRGRFGI
jgi:hypothetical protein